MNDKLAYRYRDLTHIEENSESVENADFFLSDEIIKREITSALDQIDLGDEDREFMNKTLEKKSDSLVSFLRSELKNIFLQLRQITPDINHSSKIMFIIKECKNPSFHLSESGYKKIEIPTDRIIDLLFPKNESYLKARFTAHLAHEAFHAYADERYKRASKKTTEANQAQRAGDLTLYRKDKGEIAANLYAIHYLKLRAQQLEKEDPELAKAYLEEAEEKVLDLKENAKPEEEINS
jgi:hypothetical protein